MGGDEPDLDRLMAERDPVPVDGWAPEPPPPRDAAGNGPTAQWLKHRPQRVEKPGDDDDTG